MSRRLSLIVVLLIWAAIYLPALGSLEIKGEEGRRILPAVTMLETGNYIVPQVGSEPYLRKPPLVNWLVAASFSFTRHKSEWTARLPSVLCVLAVAIAFVTIARTALGSFGALAAALMTLTSFGLIEKGRLIEIEALYVSLFGLAIISWLNFWKARASQWRTWIVPSIFLGLGLLAKGPLHLFFFYAIVIAVLFRAGEIRELWRPAHFIGIAVMLGIFAAWLVPCLIMTNAGQTAHVWSRQFSGRMAGEGFHFSSWILNIPRGLAYFLPWLIFLPPLGRAGFASSRDAQMSNGLKWGIATPFVIVNLIPGALPRYTMPLLVPTAWLLAENFAAPQFAWLRTRLQRLRERERLVFFLTTLTAVVVCGYAAIAVPRLQRREKVRSVARQIDRVIPPGETLYAIDPDYQPFLFYTHSRINYVSDVDELPADAHYALVRAKLEPSLAANARWEALHPESVLRVTDYRNVTVSVVRIQSVR